MVCKRVARRDAAEFAPGSVARLARRAERFLSGQRTARAASVIHASVRYAPPKPCVLIDRPVPGESTTSVGNARIW